MEGKIFGVYEFGGFKLDSRQRALTKNGEKVPLSARNYDLLLFMVENGGRILEHDELLDKVWVGTFVEQATLKKGISALRQILEERPDAEFIKTIPRRGYSFVSPVQVVSEANGSFYIRETEREIIVEEYEEIDDDEGNIIDIPAAQSKVLPSARIKKISFSRIAVFAGAGIFILVLVLLGWRVFSSKNVQSPFSAENVRITRITNNGKVISGTVVSPDGIYILYPTVEKDGVVLWLRQIQTNSATKLTPPMKGGFWGFAIAPDDSYVYYIFDNSAEPQKSGLYKMPMLGGEPQRIGENMGTFAISPDGKQLAIVRNTDVANISIISANGEDEHPVTTIPAGSRLWSLRWSPDGKSLLCAIRKTVDDKMLFYVAEISPENGKEKVILPAQERVVYGAEWLADKSGLLLVVRETNADIRQIWQYFPSSQEWRRITNDNNSYKLVNLTRDGKKIITNQESRLSSIWLSEGNLSQTNPADKKVRVIGRDNFHQITDGIGSFDRLGWLADGHLFYSATEDGKEILFTIGSDGTGIRQLTKGDDGMWLVPLTAGNGRNVTFLSSKEGSRQAWRIDADGKNPVKLTEKDSQISGIKVLRDNSTFIYVTQGKSGESFLYKQTPDGQTAQLTDSDTGFWAISPDEKLFTAQMRDPNTGRYLFEVRSLENGKIIKTFDISPVRQVSFTPDNKNLAYIIKQGDTSQIMIQSLEGGEPQALTDFQTDEIFSFDWSPDGTRLAVIRGKQLNDAVEIKAETKN